MNSKIYREWKKLPMWMQRELGGDWVAGWIPIGEFGYSWVPRKRDHLFALNDLALDADATMWF